MYLLWAAITSPWPKTDCEDTMLTCVPLFCFLRQLVHVVQQHLQAPQAAQPPL